MLRKIAEHRKAATVFAFTALVLLTVVMLPEVTADDILSYMPRNIAAASAFVMLVYVVKSLIFVAPALPLQIAAGYFFPLPLAIGLSLAGAAVTQAIQYGMGFYAGAEFADKLIEKYPKFHELDGLQKENSFFLCFLLRVVSILPGAVANMYFGAVRMPLSHSVIAGVIGVLPSTVLGTMIEPWIENSGSADYWVLGVAMMIMLAAFVILCGRYRKKTAEK